MWLALNIYHEARGDEQLGQIAIGHVVLNRSEDRGLTVAQVILQPYQFSWVLQKEDHFPDDMKAFEECEESARIAVQGADFTMGATHYHNVKIVPEWTNRMAYVGTYGSHAFYREN